jgi:biopolymer transport protein ExbD
MRLNKRRRTTLAEMNMTPMIDVTFLLLIFFMTATQITEVNKERVELPQQKGTEDQQPAMLTINVTEAGKIVVSGRVVSLAELMAIVSDELAKVEDDPQRLTVVLRSDARAKSRTVNAITANLGRLDITRIHLAVQVPV